MFKVKSPNNVHVHIYTYKHIYVYVYILIGCIYVNHQAAYIINILYLHHFLNPFGNISLFVQLVLDDMVLDDCFSIVQLRMNWDSSFIITRNSQILYINEMYIGHQF